MDFKNRIKKMLINSSDRFRVSYSRLGEIRKFKDSRRVAIYSKINLSSTQQRQIDELYLSNYGEKIPYTWHKHFTAFTGNFDPMYFPELLFVPEFEHFMNLNTPFIKTMEDKNFLPLIAESCNIRMPEYVLSCTYGMYRIANKKICTKEEAYEYIKQIPDDMFLKPSVDSCSGQGCRVIRIAKGVDIYTGEKLEVILSSLGSNFAIQKRLECSSSISRIYENSVNTFRIITYRWRDEIRVMPAIMRIGQGGGYLDNAHAGGMFIAISADGVLHEKAFTEFREEFLTHPDSNLTFKDYKIEGFDKVRQAALTMHGAVPQLGCINWDFTIDKYNNPVLIEANVKNGGIWIIEMAHGEGAFGNDTPEVLRWLKKMKSLKATEREPYYFGYQID